MRAEVMSRPNMRASMVRRLSLESEARNEFIDILSTAR